MPVEPVLGPAGRIREYLKSSIGARQTAMALYDGRAMITAAVVVGQVSVRSSRRLATKAVQRSLLVVCVAKDRPSTKSSTEGIDGADD